MAELTGRVAVVTGGGRGIGRAIATHLSGLGAAVGILDADESTGARTANEMRQGGGNATFAAVDVSDYARVKAALNEVRAQLGPIGILVNNAGWDHFGLFEENDPALWDRLFAVNYKGALNCTHNVIADMKAGAWGRVVTISSDAARAGSTGEAVYAGCKAALVAFSKTIARELARYGITVNVVCPGPTDTALLGEVTATERGAKVIEAVRRSTPLGRLGKPEDIPPAVAFFVSEQAAFVTGQVLSVSGGLTMVG